MKLFKHHGNIVSRGFMAANIWAPIMPREARHFDISPRGCGKESARGGGRGEVVGNCDDVIAVMMEGGFRERT